MKAVLEFILPEDEGEHYHAVNGGKAFLAMWDFDQWLRNEIKYSGEDSYQRVREQFRNIINEYNLTIDEV